MVRIVLFVTAILCVANLAQAQCRGPQCSTPGIACSTGNCNLQAQVVAPVQAPLPVAVPAVSAATSSRAVARTRVGGPLAGMKTRRAQRAVERATRANSRSRAVSRVRTSAAVEVKHDFLLAAQAIPALDEAVAQSVAMTAAPVIVASQPAAMAMAVVQ